MVDKPLECSECKKPVTVFFTEVARDLVNRSCHCSECPVLQRLVHGANAENRQADAQDKATGLCCGHCGTTLEAIRMGNPLGCPECYEFFGNLLIQDMISAKYLPSRIVASYKRSMPLHYGRCPGEATEMNPSLRLLALNEALKETLSREDYEQAAYLRDQINELMEKKPDENCP